MTLCKCGCGKEIIMKPYHKYYGIPKYIWGHHVYKSPYPPIFDLCWCGCGQIVYGGARYKKGHVARCCSAETKKKISKSKKGHWEGIKNPMYNNHRFKENNPFFGKHHSEETKKKNSKAHKGKGGCKGEKNGMYGKTGKDNPRYGVSPPSSVGHGKRYYYNSPLQDKICFRSSYELKYAQYLDSKGILWYYEIETFELSDEMTYTPDFFLIKDDKFIEIKGYMSFNAQNKINKFKEEYPWDLEILYGKDLIKLGIEL